MLLGSNTVHEQCKCVHLCEDTWGNFRILVERCAELMMGAGIGQKRHLGKVEVGSTPEKQYIKDRDPFKMVQNLGNCTLEV